MGLAQKNISSEKSQAWYRIGARYYDADLGIWTQVDAMRQHPSPYTYGSNNPLNRYDPDGNQDESVLTWEASQWSSDFYETPEEAWAKSPEDGRVLVTEGTANLLDNASTSLSYGALTLDALAMKTGRPEFLAAGGTLGAGSTALSWIAFAFDPTYERGSDAIINTVFLGTANAVGPTVRTTKEMINKNGKLYMGYKKTRFNASTANVLIDNQKEGTVSFTADLLGIIGTTIND